MVSSNPAGYLELTKQRSNRTSTPQPTTGSSVLVIANNKYFILLFAVMSSLCIIITLLELIQQGSNGIIPTLSHSVIIIVPASTDKQFILFAVVVGGLCSCVSEIAQQGRNGSCILSHSK